MSPQTTSNRKVGAHVSIAGGLPNAIQNIQNISGNCLQIFAGSPRTWARNPFPKDQVQTFNQQIAEHDLTPIFIHALYLVNLASDKPDLLEKSYQSLLMDLQNGQAINSAGVVVHLGSHQGRGFTTTKNQVVKLIKKILKNTKETPFIIENSAGQKGKIGSIEEIAILVKEIADPRVKVCLDSAHMFEAGIDLRDKKVVNQLVQDLETKNLLKHLVCLHLNDSKTVLNSGHDKHANIGEGEIGKQGLSNLINHPKLKHLPLVLEVPGQEKKGPDQKNIQTTRTLFS
jgi:deoxyribonuclease IV